LTVEADEDEETETHNQESSNKSSESTENSDENKPDEHVPEDNNEVKQPSQMNWTNHKSQEQDQERPSIYQDVCRRHWCRHF
jgi:hypothetical protein